MSADAPQTEVWINGQWKAPAEATVSVLDRGFLYGDGLFETVRVHSGRPFRWMEHLDRLWLGARFLRIRLPFSRVELTRAAEELVRRGGLPESIVRLALSRGVGPRGYSPRGADHPTVVLTLHPAPPLDAARPPRWRLITSRLRILDDDPLTQFKTANKLLQIVSRLEFENLGLDHDDALLLNTRGEVVEATSANVFWVEGGRLYTPPPLSGALPGITRGVVLELASALGIPALEAIAEGRRLHSADGVFLTLSSLGIVEVSHLDFQPLRSDPVVERLRRAYLDLASQPAAGAGG
ncbi:MAG: aminotransferase class IV [Verrucomicrobia bacterium]|nr:aminotransferase class IV [Verrucomicrobiota bacterium]